MTFLIFHLEQNYSISCNNSDTCKLGHPENTSLIFYMNEHCFPNSIDSKINTEDIFSQRDCVWNNLLQLFCLFSLSTGF
jgi:hypothetical protein